MKKLPREFYNRPAEIVAKELLGKYLIHHQQIGRIVETEAYLGPHDLAAHSAKGKTKRTEVMFGPPGFAYVYLIYGIYHCMNVVTEEEDKASAVLLRAIEPIQNIDLKSNGPGLLCKAMHIDKSCNGYDLSSDNLFIAENMNSTPFQIVIRPRIGVAYAGEWAKRPLRFYIKDNIYVSKA